MSALSLSRAARLAGISRAELQGRIRQGDLPAFEGQVEIHDLLRLYPQVSLTNDEALERTRVIAASAQPRTDDEPRDSALPGAAVLLARLREFSESLTAQWSQANAARDLLGALDARLAALSTLDDTELRGALDQCRDWLGAERARLSAQGAEPDARARLQVKDNLLRLMAAHVRLIPSGHEYFVEGQESLLDAAVRAGLHLGYGCASGNCGNCKVRLVSGQTQALRAHDYIISERERALGYLLACSHTAVTDLVIEGAEAHSVEDLPEQEIRVTLGRIEPLGDELWLVHLRTPRTQVLRFMAGQRARLEVGDSEPVELPIASCPCNGRNLWFLVRRHSAGALGEALFTGQLRHGQTLTLRGPCGHFVLKEDAPEHTLFIAIGDGIAPIKSQIEHAVSIDLIERIDLYWSNAHPEGLHQERWARSLGDALDHFSHHLLVSETPAALIAALLRDWPELAHPRVQLAGPAEWTEPLSAWLLAQGLEPARLACEHTGS